MPRVTRRRTIAAPAPEVWELVSDPYNLPRWWPRTSRVENVERKAGGRRSQWTKVLETAEGRGRARRLSAASARPRASATSGSSSSRGRRSSGTCAARRSRSACGPDGEATEVDLSSEQSLRGLSRLGSPMMRRGQGEILERRARRDRAGAGAMSAVRAATRSGGGGATRRSRRSSTRRRWPCCASRSASCSPWPRPRASRRFRCRRREPLPASLTERSAPTASSPRRRTGCATRPGAATPTWRGCARQPRRRARRGAAAGRRGLPARVARGLRRGGNRRGPRSAAAPAWSAGSSRCAAPTSA